MSYLGTQPNDVKKNIGLYTSSEILQLTKDGSWGGSLQLIQKQTVSSVTQVDFTSLQGARFDVHLLVCNVSQSGSTTNALAVRIGNASGIHSSGYHRGNQYFGTDGSFGEQRTTSGINIGDFGYTGTGHKGFYMYIYNASNSNKYTYVTNHTFGKHPTNDNLGYFGGGTYPTAEETTQIRVFAGASTLSGTLELFGIKQI